MASSELEIYNLALTAAGGKGLLDAIDDDSREAELLNLWYEPARDQVQHAAHWPETRAISRLALSVEVGDSPWLGSYPLPGYQYAYTAPADMLRPRYLAGFEPLELMISAADAQQIVTDREDAILYYSKKQTNVSTWNPSLTMATVYAVAAHIALPLTGKLSRSQTLAAQANALIIDARVRAANDATQQGYETPAPWHAQRGFSDGTGVSRFVYPNGGLISVKGSVE